MNYLFCNTCGCQIDPELSGMYNTELDGYDVCVCRKCYVEIIRQQEESEAEK
jgi:hypothetical protein